MNAVLKAIGAASWLREQACGLLVAAALAIYYPEWSCEPGEPRD